MAVGIDSDGQREIKQILSHKQVYLRKVYVSATQSAVKR
jgi:hypothetical protein